MNSSRHYSRFALACACAAALSASSALAAPAWWAARGAVTTGQTVQDYAPATVGQLKWMATKAKEELDARLSGGAGSAINAQVNAWSTLQTNGSRVPIVTAATADYAPANVGELKNVAKLFFDRLVLAGLLPTLPGGAYPLPWTSGTGDDADWAPVTLGQLKNLFDFDLVTPDRDGDGLSDLVELVYTKTSPSAADTDGNGRADGYEDADGDGIPNLDEFTYALNPTLDESGTATYGQTFAYDTLGRLLTEKDKTGHATTYTPDAEGNLKTVVP